MPIRVIISDIVLTGHPETVRTAINYGYGSDISDQIEIRAEGLDSSLAYCSSIDGVMVVRSTTGMSGSILTAATYWPVICTVMPQGSNSFIRIEPPTSVPVIVTTGAGVVVNETAYGAGLEFHDDDLGEPGSLSSWSNGVIAGKLLRIKDLTGWDWWQVRYACRLTGTNDGARTDQDGYGVIDLERAIEYSGDWTDDPYQTGLQNYDNWNQKIMAIKRQTIMTAVKTRLQTITTGAGYYTNIGSKVFDWKLEPFTAEELPGVTVQDVGQDRADMGNSQRGVFYYDLKLEIRACHVGFTGSTLVEYLRKAIIDIQKAFQTDLTFGGTVIAAMYEGDQIDIESAETNKGTATINIILRYFTDSWKEE
jgi:hypothetical protein